MSDLKLVQSEANFKNSNFSAEANMLLHESALMELNSSLSEASVERRKMSKAANAYEAKIEELVIENYDNVYRHPGDVIDEGTKLKTEGYYDYEKFEGWAEALSNAMKRRLKRDKDKIADKNYFNLMR